MKLKVTIAGPKVHDVGYRVYLSELAMRLAVRGFEVYNDDEKGQQVVIALLEGDEQRTKRFCDSVMAERPQLASVDKVRAEDFTGDVMPLWQFASINTATQMNKAIPLLLDMRDDLKAVRKTTDANLEETKAVREISEATLEETKAVREISEATLEETKAVRKIGEETLEETKAVRKIGEETLEETKAVRKIGEETLVEIKGLREDIQPGYAMQFRQMQVDVRAIKERLGMS